MYFVGLGRVCMGYMCILCGGGVLRISNIFRTAGFVVICDLVVCVCNLLPVLLSYVEVLF
jgi:hypothetical protein